MIVYGVAVLLASPLVGFVGMLALCAWADRRLNRAFRELDERYPEDRIAPGPPPWPRGR